MTEQEKLRAERKLNPLPDGEQGASIDLVSGGVYGFTYSPSTDGVPLFNKSGFQAFEVHKLVDNTIHILGYMTDKEAKAFENTSDALDLQLYPEPWEDAKHFVSIPRARILKIRQVSRERGNYLPITVV